MTREQIEENLRRFDRDIDEIHEVHAEKPKGFPDIIQEKYRALREEIESEHERPNSAQGMRAATDDALTFYYPALHDILQKLATKGGAKASLRMIDDVSAASRRIKHHLLELGNAPTE